MAHDAARQEPANSAEAIALAVDGCRVLTAAGQSDLVWGTRTGPLGWFGS